MTFIPKWAMLGSNQRLLPCEGGAITSWLFVCVQKCLQISIFFLAGYREWLTYGMSGGTVCRATPITKSRSLCSILEESLG
jgi:hypothetical protein